MAGVRLNRTFGERWEAFLDALAAQGHTRRFRRGLALALLVVTGMAALALVSWSVDDPSLNHATDAPVTNWMGARGAIFADMAMQLFGLASVAVIVVLLEWSRRWMVGAVVPRIGGRALVLLLGLPFVGALLSHLPTPMSWPLPTGLGGVVGDLTDGMIGSLLAGVGLPAKISAALALLVSGLALRHASAMRVPLDATRAMPRPKPEPRVEEPAPRRGPAIHTPDEDEAYEEDDRAGAFAVAAGGVAHAAMSTKGLFSRLLRPRMPAFEPEDEAVEAPRAAPEFARQEPAFARQEPAFAPPEPVYAEPTHYMAPQPVYAPVAQAEPAPVQPVPVAPAPAPIPQPSAAQEPQDAEEAPHARLAALDEEGPRDFERLAFDDPEEDEVAPLAEVAPVQQAAPSPRPAPAPAPQAPVMMPRAVAPAPRPKPANDASRAYEQPPLDLLSLPGPQQQDPAMSRVQLGDNAQMLEGVLDDFGIRGEIVDVRPGPVVTLYELQPAPGIKSSRVIGLADDIARSMSAISARVAVVPGRNAIGIELPNRNRQTVYLREILEADAFDKSKARLPMCLGKTIGGEPVVADLARMPHLLIAGTTGSGKSVAVNTMILSLLYRLNPEQCRLIMIDPKMLELSVYDGIPHLLSPVVTDPKKAVVALKWTVREME
ncbi:MAG: DNA translocase FtsK 4TM domain-containing protein, partial [Pseudomonadota bacterium]